MLAAVSLAACTSGPERALSGASGPKVAASPQDPVLLVDGMPSAAEAVSASVDWASPLTVTSPGRRVTSVVARGPDGSVDGQLAADAWTSSETLIPAATYQLAVTVSAADGRSASHLVSVRTRPAGSLLNATIGTADNEVVGVGEPVVVYFDKPVRSRSQREQVEARLSVVSRPAVVGAWHWVNEDEVHYRPAQFWAAGTTLSVAVDLQRLRLDGTRTWGSGGHRSTYRIGSSLISTVDVAAHTMTVRRGGVLLRTLRVSTGRDKYPTKGGVHIVLEKQADQLFDSQTVGIPTASPDGYFEHLPWSVRISDGGAFVHANPATVRFQGSQNVSHGCVNLSLSDAEWYFHLARRGDVVNVMHASVGPQLSDPGMADWNLSFADWKSGH